MTFLGRVFAAILLATAGFAHAESKSLVRSAADAIVAGDAETLKTMRFTAYGLDNRPISVEQLLARLSQCRATEPTDKIHHAYPRQIHFECSSDPAERGTCDSDTLIVAIDRATSPDVFAQLRFKRLETEECKLPRPPSP